VPDDRTADPSTQPGGHRRIDRVLAEGYLDGLAAMPLAEVRERIRQREEAAEAAEQSSNNDMAKK